MEVSIKRQWPRWAFIAAIPFALAIILFLMQREFARGDALSAQVDASHRARAQVARLLAAHQDVEVGQRGYLLTGNEAFLEPYLAALPRIEDSFAQLGSSVATRDELAQLHQLSSEKLAFAAETVGKRRAGDPEGARQMVADGRGKAVMDRLRGLVAKIEKREEDRLAARREAALAARERAKVMVVSIALVMAIALVLALATLVGSLEQRSLAAQRYRDASRRLEAIFRGSKDGLITINASGTIETVNAAVLDMTGYGEGELEHHDIGTLFEIAPDTGGRETFLRRLARRALRDDGGVITLSARRKDERFFPVDVTVSPVELERGRILVANVRDATERRRVEQMKSEFVSTVSHELRTPLTSIAGSLGLIAGGAVGELPEKAARLVGIARSNCERLVRLINDILDMEKLESGKMEFSLRDLALDPFLRGAIDANTGFAQQYGVQLVLEPVPDGATVVADPDQLMQVLTNLLSNAVKFSERGSAVAIRVLPLDRRWRIDVEDHGSGIPEEFRARIFNKFAQAESSDNRAKGGTGLGLSIVREIVVRMGGEVNFTSAPDEGTTFHVDLPARLPVAMPPAPTASDVAVLHVEDDPDVLAIVADALGSRYSLHPARTLAEARQQLGARPFDVVILDVSLPDGSGRDLVGEIRAHHTPILVFTAQDSDAALAHEVDDVLVKSRASLEGLAERLDRLLDNARTKGARP